MTKKNLQYVFTACFAVILLFGCKKFTQTADENTNAVTLSTDEITLIKKAGLNPTGATKEGDKYLIEGDLLLSATELKNLDGNNGPELIIANSEQYCTTNLVTGLPRQIKVRYTGTNTTLSNSIDAAITRYNALGLTLTFVRVTTNSTNGDIINVTTVNGGNYIASSGFPSGGNAYGSVVFNLHYVNMGANTLTSVLAHEMGHCIGFRHTDYMDRSYSCGGHLSNEGQAGIGAIQIPGTPVDADPNSWMLSCIGNGVDRPFNANDIIALDYLY
jgi:hypothetical protein